MARVLARFGGREQARSPVRLTVLCGVVQVWERALCQNGRRGGRATRRGFHRGVDSAAGLLNGGGERLY